MEITHLLSTFVRIQFALKDKVSVACSMPLTDNVGGREPLSSWHARSFVHEQKGPRLFFCQSLYAINGIGSCVWRSPALLNFQLVRQVLTASHLVCGCCFSHMPWSDGRRATGCTWACSCNCRIVSKPEGVSLMRDTEDNFPCSVIFSHISEFKAYTDQTSHG
jgi:hypothetical protein